MNVDQIMQRIINNYEHLSRNVNWGERGLFYNPGNRLPLGAYMLTFKEKDGKNDSSSRIDSRPNRFRLNLKISKDTFIKLFEKVPQRPPAGGVVATGHNFAQTDTIMPHPVYGWMTWICVVNPSEETIARMESLNLFDEAYAAAVKTFDKKTGTKSQNSSALFLGRTNSRAESAPAPTTNSSRKKRKMEDIVEEKDPESHNDSSRVKVGV